MDVHRYSFLAGVLGPDGATALAKAVERQAVLVPVIVPRTILAWLRLQDPVYEGQLPGVGDSYLAFSKSEDAAGTYTGTIAVGAQAYGFEGATALHLASAIGVALGVDADAVDPRRLRDLDVQRLGKSIDLLARARQAVSDLGKRQLDPSAGYTLTHEHIPSMDVHSNGRSTPVTGVYAFAAGVKPEPGAHVGHVTFRHRPDGNLESVMTAVDEAHQRQGLASAMYAHAEKVTGKKVVPSSSQTDEGAALWASNRANPQFGIVKAESGSGEGNGNPEHVRRIKHWQETGDLEDRHFLADRGRMPRAELERALQKLHGLTQMRRNSKTLEREFLLHRGMSQEELKEGLIGKGFRSKEPTSWTPSRTQAIRFAKDALYDGDFSPGHVVSAWISEKHIAHMPGEVRVGAKLPGVKLPREHEVIVRPHESEVHQAVPVKAAAKGEDDAAKAEAPGPEAAPQGPGGPQAPTPPQKQPKLGRQQQQPQARAQVRLTRSEVRRPCPVCGQSQFVGERLRGCACFEALCKSEGTEAQRTISGWTLTFGPEWDPEAMETFLQGLHGRARDPEPAI